MSLIFRISLIILFYLFGLAICPHAAIAQQKPAGEQSPKIGLVLSGGGAKGLSHVGVLKVLEEAGIRPDYITGTSMGSIIGALYALGYTANEIDSISRELDWDMLLSDKIPLNKIVVQEKYDYERYLVRFPIRDYKFKLPSAVIEGQQIEKKLLELTWPLTDHEDFDEFPIPFRCMSVDLISGETIEHSSGSLVEAIRASMAIPSVFSPEKIDDMLLVDGGLTSNFPVEQVRNMGADIVIGVYVGFEDKVDDEDLFSLTDVLTRSVALAGIVDARRQMEQTDILILPDLLNFSAADYDNTDEIIDLGEIAARAYFDQFKSLADSLGRNFEPTGRYSYVNDISISAVDVKGLRFLSKEFVIGQSKLLPGQTLNFALLQQAINRIYGTNYFTKVTATLQHSNDSSYTLVFHAIEKTRAHINIGLHYSNEQGAGVHTNLTLRNYILPSSRASASFNIAENPGFRIDLDKFVGQKQRFIASLYAYSNRDEIPIYEGGFEMGDFIHNYGESGIALKYSVGLNRQIGVTGGYEYHRIRPNENLKFFYPEVSFDSYLTSGYVGQAYAKVNTTDDWYFPAEGVRGILKYKYFLEPKSNIDTENLTPDIQGLLSLNENSFHNLTADVDFYTTIARRYTMIFGGSLGLNSQDESVSGWYMLGGIHQDYRANYQSFAGMRFAELIATNYAAANAGLNIRLYQRIYISMRANIGYSADKPEDMLNIINDWNTNIFIAGYSAGMQLDTGLGPVQFMVGRNNLDNETRFFMSIGYPF